MDLDEDMVFDAEQFFGINEEKMEADMQQDEELMLKAIQIMTQGSLP